MSTFIDVEEAIIARLGTKLATLDKVPKIYSAIDLENAKDKSQLAATVFVAYNGIVNVEQLNGAPHIAHFTQEFIIWTVTRSASRHGSQQGTREIADPILEGIMQALMGWRPATGLPPLALAETTGPAYGEGFGYFPLTFIMKRQVRGDIN
jgi:hypothetical protein